jgi:hypothetical protein
MVVSFVLCLASEAAGNDSSFPEIMREMKCRLALDSIAPRYARSSMHAGYRTDWRSAFLTVAESASDGKGERRPLRAARNRK